MGNWSISIQGTGSHHNENNPNDADKLARDFVKKLQESSQSVSAATFTVGNPESLK